MVKVTIKDKDFITELERLQNEVQSRQSIISYMISNNMDITSDNFQKYQNDYTDYMIKYENKKAEVEKKYVYPNFANAKNWSLDFASGELIIK
jgi:methyl coenzyme M reductase subunit D